MKILIVDGDQNVLRAGKERMTKAGWEVITASDGVTAIELFEKQKHTLDLVTLAIQLPDIDGMKILRLMIEKRHSEKPLIFMVTAFDYRDDFSVWASNWYIIKSAETWEEVLCTYKQRFTK